MTAGDLIVRPADSGDLEAVARVWHESASSMGGAPVEVPRFEALRGRDAELAAGWDLHVAVLGGRVVGMLALKGGTLDQIFVSPAQQGRGIGRALLAVAKRAMPHGFTLRMDAANEKARLFYEAEGLTKVGEGTHPWTGIPVQFYGWNVT